MGINDAEIRFKASLEDEVSPKAEKLEAKLKAMGATPAEIKMYLRAHDEATPKIKEVRKHLSLMEKAGMLQLHADSSKAIQGIDKVRQAAKEPIRLTFLDNLEETSQRLFTLRSKVPIPGGIPGT